MADAACASTNSPIDDQELNEIRAIVWGPSIRLDVFQRWSQGNFSMSPCIFNCSIAMRHLLVLWLTSWNRPYLFTFWLHCSPCGLKHKEIAMASLNCFLIAGFEFSEAEPSALVQRQGGPCAVIAPVQAFILKTIITETHGHSFGDVRIFSLFFAFISFASVVLCAFTVIVQTQCINRTEHNVQILCHQFWHSIQIWNMKMSCALHVSWDENFLCSTGI